MPRATVWVVDYGLRVADPRGLVQRVTGARRGIRIGLNLP